MSDTVNLQDALKVNDNLPGVQYGTELTTAADITRSAHVFKTTLWNKATDDDLTLKKADWVAGDWFIIRQVGDGQATIVAEDTNVKLPDWDKTAGEGFDMFVECYKIDGSDKYFNISGGSL